MTAEEAARPDAQYLGVVECSVCPFRVLTSRAPLTGKDREFALRVAARLNEKGLWPMPSDIFERAAKALGLTATIDTTDDRFGGYSLVAHGISLPESAAAAIVALADARDAAEREREQWKTSDQIHARREDEQRSRADAAERRCAELEAAVVAWRREYGAPHTGPVAGQGSDRERYDRAIAEAATIPPRDPIVVMREWREHARTYLDDALANGTAALDALRAADQKRIAEITAFNESMRDGVRGLRERVGMPAEGEGDVLRRACAVIDGARGERDSARAALAKARREGELDGADAMREAAARSLTTHAERNSGDLEASTAIALIRALPLPDALPPASPVVWGGPDHEGVYIAHTDDGTLRAQRSRPDGFRWESARYGIAPTLEEAKRAAEDAHRRKP